MLKIGTGFSGCNWGSLIRGLGGDKNCHRQHVVCKKSILELWLWWWFLGKVLFRNAKISTWAAILKSPKMKMNRWNKIFQGSFIKLIFWAGTQEEKACHASEIMKARELLEVKNRYSSLTSPHGILYALINNKLCQNISEDGGVGLHKEILRINVLRATAKNSPHATALCEKWLQCVEMCAREHANGVVWRIDFIDRFLCARTPTAWLPCVRAHASGRKHTLVNAK